MDVLRTSRLVSEGLQPKELVGRGSDSGLVRIRHGAYAKALADDPEGRHRQLIAATWPLLGGQAVLSHGSAALLHGLPVWNSLLEQVGTTRPVGGHGRRGRNLHVRLAELADSEVTEVDGFACTSLERTAIDMARLVSYERAVAVLDAAVRLGADPEMLGEIAARAKGRRGAGTASRALEFADGRAESVGESISRVRIVQVGLPVPDLQFNVFDRNGIWVARSDFCWREKNVVGEFDGRVKYRGGAEEVATAVMREKAREQAIRDAGWWVVRWDWSDLADGNALRRRIETAFRRSTGQP